MRAYTSMYAWTLSCLYVYVCVCVCVCVCIYMCVCVCVCVYAYLHTRQGRLQSTLRRVQVAHLRIKRSCDDGERRAISYVMYEE
jgi:hypothetical protein